MGKKHTAVGFKKIKTKLEIVYGRLKDFSL